MRQNLKIPITLQIPEFKDTFAKIKEYKILDQTIISNTKNEVKLDAIRKLNKTNISKYESFLINTIGKKNKLLSLVIGPAGISDGSIWTADANGHFANVNYSGGHYTLDITVSPLVTIENE
ncbi:hypothetical protein N9Q89_03645 [Flavobacteriaceae bacterium]|nr:hypothetical protein [Flavobacteriaceae bacterium]